MVRIRGMAASCGLHLAPPPTVIDRPRSLCERSPVRETRARRKRGCAGCGPPKPISGGRCRSRAGGLSGYVWGPCGTCGPGNSRPHPRDRQAAVFATPGGQVKLNLRSLRSSPFSGRGQIGFAGSGANSPYSGRFRGRRWSRMPNRLSSLAACRIPHPVPAAPALALSAAAESADKLDICLVQATMREICKKQKYGRKMRMRIINRTIY